MFDVSTFRPQETSPPSRDAPGLPRCPLSGEGTWRPPSPLGGDPIEEKCCKLPEWMPAAGPGPFLGESVPARTTRHQRTTLTELRSGSEDPRRGCTRRAGKGVPGATLTVTANFSPGPPAAQRHPRAPRRAALTNTPEGRARRGAVT